MPLPFILAGAAVAVAGVGAKKGVDGFKKNSKANEINELAKEKYQISKATFNKANSETEQSLEKLGHFQLKIGSQFKKFATIADSLLEKLNKDSSHKELVVNLPNHRLNQIEDVSISATEFLGKMAVGTGAGVASAYAVYGGVMALAAASTGTPIAALSGAAAYNATMAAIGGGAISAGGFGMAGGAMVLGGVVAAPILAAAGFVFDKFADNKLENAQKYLKEVEDAVLKMDISIKQLHKITSTVEDIYSSLVPIYKIYLGYFEDLKNMDSLVRNGANLDLIEEPILRIISNGYQIAAILTDIITTPLFKLKKVNGEVVVNEDKSVQFETDSTGMQVLNKDEIDDVLVVSKAEIIKRKKDN
ncbi:chemotaxis protein [[Haemophilus] felis]|nr:chemotaxis protein [[Haemophilus] felis]